METLTTKNYFSPLKVSEKVGAERYEKYLKTGFHDSSNFSKTSDMLDYLKNSKL